MAAAEVYIDRANTCFRVMNKAYLYLLLAALVGLCPVHAKNSEVADVVHVSLNHKNISGPQKFVALAPPSDKDIFKPCGRMGLTSLEDTKDNQRWFVLNIPICITGAKRVKGSSYKAATVVPELTVKVYLIYRSKDSKRDKKDPAVKEPESEAAKFRLVEKEITYVDIPLKKGSKKEKSADVGYVEMSVGLFIPQTVATLMTGDENPEKTTSSADLTIAGYAIEPSVKGSPCKAVGDPIVSATPDRRANDKLFDPTLEKRLKGIDWWKSKAKEHFPVPPDVRLLCISETPFAPFYGSFYPATRPLYGEPAASGSSSSDSSSGSDGSTPTSATDTPVQPEIPVGTN